MDARAEVYTLIITAHLREISLRVAFSLERQVYWASSMARPPTATWLEPRTYLQYVNTASCLFCGSDKRRLAVPGSIDSVLTDSLQVPGEAASGNLGGTPWGLGEASSGDANLGTQ